MAERCAVIGIGQTKHASNRSDVSMPGLVREAAIRALEDAQLDWADIDAVVIGKAPDMFEGVMMPELSLASALGAVGKPIIRVHTAGSVGGSTAVAATHFVMSGVFDTVLTVAYEKQSEVHGAHMVLSQKMPFAPPVMAGAGSYFAPTIRAYIAISGAPPHIGYKVAVKDRLNALRNPYAHLQLPDISIEKVEESPMLWDPLRYLETCPSSDGAGAMVLSGEKGAETAPQPPAWVQGVAVRSEPGWFPGRGEVDPRAGRDCSADVYAQAGVTDPRRQIRLAEIYVPFSWYEPMWLENLGFCDKGEGWKLVEDDITAFEGDLPINPSGGVLSSNPIGASGMLRFLEAARQVRGQADGHQLDGVQKAMGHAYGGASQFFAMWVVGTEKP